MHALNATSSRIFLALTAKLKPNGKTLIKKEGWPSLFVSLKHDFRNIPFGQVKQYLFVVRSRSKDRYRIDYRFLVVDRRTDTEPENIEIIPMLIKQDQPKVYRLLAYIDHRKTINVDLLTQYDLDRFNAWFSMLEQQGYTL